jgi:hypothetical protein
VRPHILLLIILAAQRLSSPAAPAAEIELHSQTGEHDIGYAARLPITRFRELPTWSPSKGAVPLPVDEAAGIARDWILKQPWGHTFIDFDEIALRHYTDDPLGRRNGSRWYYFFDLDQEIHDIQFDPGFVIVLLDKTVLAPVRGVYSPKQSTLEGKYVAPGDKSLFLELRPDGILIGPAKEGALAKGTYEIKGDTLEITMPFLGTNHIARGTIRDGTITGIHPRTVYVKERPAPIATPPAPNITPSEAKDQLRVLFEKLKAQTPPTRVDFLLEQQDAWARANEHFSSDDPELLARILDRIAHLTKSIVEKR